MILCRFLLEVISETLQTPFKTFLQYFVQKRKALLSKCCSSEKKLVKLAILRPCLGKNRARMGHTQNQVWYFFLEITKGVMIFQKRFSFIKILKVLIELRMISFLCEMLLSKLFISCWNNCYLFHAKFYWA